MSPRWFDGTDHLALDTGGGPIARLWSTALSGLVDIGLRQGHRPQRGDQPAEDGAASPRSPSSGRSRSGRNTIERDRARTYFQAYAAAAALTSSRRRWPRCAPGSTKTWEPFEVPDEAHRLRLHRGGARRALAPHGDQGRQDRQLPPVPADAVERQPARHLRHARALRGRGAEHADLRGERPDNFKGIDIMRAVRSFDPCLPCGVHMYLGNGKVLKKVHSPTQVGRPPSWPG